MNYHGVGGADICVLVGITSLGAFLFVFGLYIITIGDIEIGIVAVGAGVIFTSMVNCTVTADIIQAYKRERQRKERQDIPRPEPWTPER
jgi:hypothetical protein